MKRKLLMQKLLLVFFVSVSASALNAQTVVSEGWDESSAQEIWCDMAVDWMIDWVTTYSDGTEERTPFFMSEHRQATALTEWYMFVGVKYATRSFSDLNMKEVSSEVQQKEINGAIFTWTNEKREITDVMTYSQGTIIPNSIYDGAYKKNGQKVNKWETVDPFNCKVTYKGKEFSFDQKTVTVARKDSLIGNSVYDNIIYSIGDNVKNIPAIVGYNSSDNGFFPPEWGWLCDVKQTVANNYNQNGFVYIWSLHFSKGILPLVVASGSSNPEWHFEYFHYTAETLCNSAFWDTSNKRWSNAIASDDVDMMRWRLPGDVMDSKDIDEAVSQNWDEGRGGSVYTNRYDMTLDDGTLSVTDTYTGKQVGTWYNSGFKSEWGKLVDVKQSLANNISHDGYVYIWSLHFSGGYVLPVVVKPNTVPFINFDYCEQTPNATYNSAYYDSSSGKWVNAIAWDGGIKMQWAREGEVVASKEYEVASSQNWDEGHGTSVNTNRFDISVNIPSCRFTCKDTYRNVYMGSWAGANRDLLWADEEFRRNATKSQSYRAPLNIGNHGKVIYNGTEYTGGASITTEECKLPDWQFQIIPDDGYELASVRYGGMDLTDYVKDNILSFHTLGNLSNLSFTFISKDRYPFITFADASTEAVCLAKWDLDKNGKLSMSEAKDVETISFTTAEKEKLTSFDEFQYFTGVNNIAMNVQTESGPFVNCKNLSSITIPDGMGVIGYRAFKGCNALTTITIPSSVTGVSNWAFLYCNNLTTVISYITEPSTIIEDAFGTDVYSNATLWVPAGTSAKYKKVSGWKNFQNIKEMNSDIRGDANNDGEVDVADIVAIVNHLNGNTPDNFNLKQADADNNNEVNMADVEAVARIIMKL